MNIKLSDAFNFLAPHGYFVFAHAKSRDDDSVFACREDAEDFAEQQEEASSQHDSDYDEDKRWPIYALWAAELGDKPMEGTK